MNFYRTLLSPVFVRRLKTYLIGVSLGLVLCYVFFNNRYPTWLPGSVIMEELTKYEPVFSAVAICQMECDRVSKENVGELLSQGKVNFKKSDAHAAPCPTYAIEGKAGKDRLLRIIVAKCDSATEVLMAGDLNISNDCGCD